MNVFEGGVFLRIENCIKMPARAKPQRFARFGRGASGLIPLFYPKEVIL